MSGSVACSTSTSTCCSGVSPVAGSVRRMDPGGPITSASRLSWASLVPSARCDVRSTSDNVTCADDSPRSLASTDARRERTHAASAASAALAEPEPGWPALPPAAASPPPASPPLASSTCRRCSALSFLACLAQSICGSEMKTSITRSSSSRAARRARRTCDICALRRTPASSGRSTEVICRVRRTPTSSGWGSR
eukprot:scaffold17682_cov113-Isochrysis_galbana.AAC.10